MGPICVRTVKRIGCGLLLALFVLGVMPAQAQYGTITGRISKASDNSDLPGIRVQLFDAAGNLYAETAGSASDGSWSVTLPPGTYYAKAAAHAAPFINQLYNGIQ